MSMLKFVILILVFVLAIWLATFFVPPGGAIITVAIGWMASSIYGGIKESIDLRYKKEV